MNPFISHHSHINEELSKCLELLQQCNPVWLLMQRWCWSEVEAQIIHLQGRDGLEAPGEHNLLKIHPNTNTHKHLIRSNLLGRWLMMINQHFRFTNPQRSEGSERGGSAATHEENILEASPCDVKVSAGGGCLWGCGAALCGSLSTWFVLLRSGEGL